jgi:hypothetical protein
VRKSGPRLTRWSPRLVTESADGAGTMIVSYNPVVEASHRVGQLLRNAGGHRLAGAVESEVRVELDAVVRAELGDLSGRAVQAVAVDRLDASPVQVTAADAMLEADPLGSGLLSAPIDPAAACIAAPHWLAAAAGVTARVAGNAPGGVFAEADAIEPVSVEIPSRRSGSSRHGPWTADSR